MQGRGSVAVGCRGSLTLREGQRRQEAAREGERERGRERERESVSVGGSEHSRRSREGWMRCRGDEKKRKKTGQRREERRRRTRRWRKC